MKLVMRTLSLALLPALVGACGIPKEVHERELAKSRQLATDKQKLTQEKGELARLVEALKGRLEGLGQDLSKLKEVSETSSAELELARRRMEELQRMQEASEARLKQFRGLVSKFQKMITDGKLAVEVRNGRMVVKLPDDILFDPGKTELKPAGKEALGEVARILATVSDREFRVAGHTDNVPIRSKRFRSNWELSTARALEVLRILREAGMDASRLSASGYADQAPIADNSTDEGRRKNRRIEIILEPNIAELPNLDELLKPRAASASQP